MEDEMLDTVMEDQLSGNGGWWVDDEVQPHWMDDDLHQFNQNEADDYRHEMDDDYYDYEGE